MFPTSASRGGVALNSLANGRIQRELGYDLFIQPAAGDAGGALGAAMLVHATRTGRRPEAPTTALLGRAFGDAEIDDALEAFQMTDVVRFDDEGELLRKTAELLAEGKVIGWFQGREEWGPRALGARSILADPTRSDMQRTINEKIKFREPFRPFAPAVFERTRRSLLRIARDRRTVAPGTLHAVGGPRAGGNARASARRDPCGRNRPAFNLSTGRGVGGFAVSSRPSPRVPAFPCC